MRREKAGRDDPALVLDICEAARLIGRFVEGLDLADFLEDEKTQSAVILQLLLIGESAKKLSPTFRQHLPTVPWSRVGRMRDKLIHHYEGRDLELVWAVARTEVPELLRLLGQQAD